MQTYPCSAPHSGIIRKVCENTENRVIAQKHKKIPALLNAGTYLCTLRSSYFVFAFGAVTAFLDFLVVFTAAVAGAAGGDFAGFAFM